MQVSFRTSPGERRPLTRGPPGVSQEPVSPLAVLAAVSWLLPALTFLGQESAGEPGGDLGHGSGRTDSALCAELEQERIRTCHWEIQWWGHLQDKGA